MSRHRYNLVCIVVSMTMLIMSAELWSPQGTSVAHAIPCGINCENVTNSPSASLTLNGTDQTASYTLTFSLNTTLNLGWNVTITSTQFTTGAIPMHTLPTTASTVTGITAVCTPGQVCLTMPQNTVIYPVAVPAGNPAPAAVKFCNAQALSGLGTFDLTTTIKVMIPARVYAGSYTSTITLAYVSGP